MSLDAGSLEVASEIDVLILRLEATLLSFGGVAVDERRPSDEYPSRSLLVGLLANALGWNHGDFEKLDRLQARLRHAARRDRRGTRLDDYHTVDLGQDFMRQGWTTRGRVEGRGGGSATGTHIRDRRYWADAAYTVALALDPADESPTLDDLAAAVMHPERPLFLGRKTCLPSRPLVAEGELHRLRAPSLVDALARVPRWTRGEESPTLRAWWTDGDPAGPARAERTFPARDHRDWRNQVHVGRRFLVEGELTLVESEPTTIEEAADG